MAGVRVPRMLEPLRIRDFALLWAGMSVSLVGDAIFLVALAWQVYELSNDPSALGWILAAYVTPMVVFLLAGGVLTDRFERRKMMIVADVIRALAIGTAGALAIAGTLELWQLAVCAAVTGVGDALFAPAFGSIVPEIVPRDSLAQANALDQFVRPIAGMLGPALAGVLIALSGAGVALVVDAATFCASTAAALLLTPRPFERRPGRSALRDVREGFAFVRARTWLWATLAIAGLLNIAPAARNVLLPFVVKNDLHSSAAALGAVYSATAAGALLSALAYGQRGLPRRFVVVMYVGWACATFVIAGYGLATGVWQMVVLGFVAGLGLALGQAIWGTMMHHFVPRELLGRVTSLDWLISTSLMPVSMIAVGFLGDAIGPGTTLVLAGAIGGTLTLLAVLIPGVRDPERDGSDALGEPLRESIQP
jgi:DHA3 family tetracycline resistance protein-like MFS transporter